MKHFNSISPANEWRRINNIERNRYIMKTKILFGFIFAAIVGMVFTLPKVASAVDVVVIANKMAPASSLYKEEVKNIFLAKKTQWNNGQKINLATLKKCQTHDDFLRKYLQKTPSQFQSYYCHGCPYPFPIRTEHSQAFPVISFSD